MDKIVSIFSVQNTVEYNTTSSFYFLDKPGIVYAEPLVI